eukprot:365664-Chlamydomonas_euryale.AAC.19
MCSGWGWAYLCWLPSESESELQGGYVCVEPSKTEEIKQRAGRRHKGKATVHSPEPTPIGCHTTPKSIMTADQQAGAAGAAEMGLCCSELGAA